MKISTALNVRAVIASHVVGNGTDLTLGSITLHPHQADGARRVNALLDAHRGALLADSVGLGKTYVALAVASTSRWPLVIAPAAVREPWIASSQASRVPIRFISTEALSRGASADGEHDLIVIDEAHHFRNRHTKRFAIASRVCERARVLLLSATPVQNRLDDLRSILSLFLGNRADALDAQALAQFVVRRVSVSANRAGARLPRVAEPKWVGPINDTDCLEQLVSLPAPVPPTDGGLAGALLTYTLVRQWSSSRAALRGALMRRTAQSRAMEDGLRVGRRPSRDELAAWFFAEDTQQLAFPELLTEETSSTSSLLDSVQSHTSALRALLSDLSASPDPDAERAALLMDLFEAHRDERFVVFTELTDTAKRIFALISPSVRAACLTHRGGRVAGGNLGRSDILRQFGPKCQASHADRIDVLITTDLLSEGVNLQAASVVVHLDLPWNPARLEQRVGRLRRLGAIHDTITVYAFAPPAPAERLLHLEQRLQQKLRVAGRSIGNAGSIIPGFSVGDISATAARERIVNTLNRWLRDTVDREGCPVAACTAATGRSMALVCVRRDKDVELLALDQGEMTGSPVRIADIMDCVDNHEFPVDVDCANAALTSIRTWLRRRSVTEVVNLPAMRLATSRRALLRRVDAIASRTPRHAQLHLAPFLRAARSAAMLTMSMGAERVLSELVTAQMNDSAWLSAIGQFVSLHTRTIAPESEILALLLLEPVGAPPVKPSDVS
jgi:superfamily II DNA or RNA helicase